MRSLCLYSVPSNKNGPLGPAAYVRWLAGPARYVLEDSIVKCTAAPGRLPMSVAARGAVADYSKDDRVLRVQIP